MDMQKGEPMSEYIVRETGYPGAVKQEIVGELVRCQDCIWWDTQYPYGTLVPDAYHCKTNDRFYGGNHFCAYGERKNDEERT